MSNEKKLINSIKQDAIDFKNDEKYKERYEEYENMKQTLSDNLYSKNSHFIYELIQNAEDNTYNNKVEPELKFIITENGILTQNNEIGFNESNIKSICKFSTSSKKGQKELGYIGEKGLGFKSVFAISSKPAIFSSGYQFYFSEGEYTIPHWIDTEKLKLYPKEFYISDSTNIYLPFKKDFLYKDDINRKIEDIEPIVLLFLTKLKKLQILNNDEHLINVTKESPKSFSNFNKSTLKYNKIEDTFYIIKKVVIKPDDIDEPKRENVLKREIFLAFPSFDNKENEDRIFSFLPTEMRTDLPFLIQSDFLLIGNRENLIEDNRWNLWLMDEIVDFFVEEFHYLKEVDKYKYLKYLDKQQSSHRFIDKYYQQILEQLKQKKLFLSIEDNFVSSSQICILDDYDFMYEYLQNVDYLNSDGEIFSYAHKDFYIPKYLMEKWEITTIGKNDFLRIIGDLSELFAEQFNENNLLFEQLLQYIGKEYKTKKYLFNLPIIPFDDGNNIIFKTKKELENIQLFFKLDDDGVLNNVFSDLKIISNKYQEDLQDIPFYSEVFEVKQPDIVEILKSLENNDEFFTDIDNNINLLVYIKNNYLGENQKQIIELLAKNYQFISKKNYFIEHEYREAYSWAENSSPEFSTTLYISKEYLNSKNSIEKIVNKYCTEQGKKNVDFISEKYLEYDKTSSDKELKDLQKEWRDFFDELKINDDMKLESENLEMWANDSQYHRRIDIEKIQNIPFIASPKFTDPWDTNYKIINLDIQKLSKYDSVFLFKKLLKLPTISSGYHRVNSYYRGFQHKYVTIPWIDTIKDNYPIFTGEEKYKIKDFYLEVDEALQKFFQSLPKEYLTKENSNIDKIFNIKEKPSLDDTVELIENKKIKNYKDIKSIFSYIHFHHPELELELNEIPISVKGKIKYITLDKLIWKDGAELNLIEIESSYGSDFKNFFVEQVGIQETPTIEQYIEYLKKNPKNYIKILHKFILQIDEFLDVKYKYPMESEKIFLINKKLFSIDEIIFNDEGIKTTVIPNLFNINQKIVPIFEKIVNEYHVKRISTCSREIQTFNAETNDEIRAVYIKLLNFTWDYIFSKNQKKFEELKNDKEFILETKNVILGASAEIVLKIDVNGKYIDIEQDIAILDDTIYLSKSIDERKVGTEISKYIVKKIGIDFEKIERFYDKVYRIKDYSKDEYYEEEHIEEPTEDEDKFDNVFEKLLNTPEEENDKIDSNLNEPPNYTESDSLREENETDSSSQNNSKTSPAKKAKKLKIKCKKCGELIDRDKYKLHLYKIHFQHDIDPDDDSIFDEKENKSDVKKKPTNEKTRCPECNIELNSKNLKKHLCKMHHQNCGDVDNLDPNTSPDLAAAIGAHEKEIDKRNEEIDLSIIKDEEKFREELQNRYDENLKKTNSITKNNYVLRKVKIGKKETKDFLKNQYGGYCQICGFTFDQKNHQGKYFESFDWLSEKISGQKTNIMDAGSSLCLCSRCHAGVKYGDFEAKFLIKLKNIDLSKYTFDKFILDTNTAVKENEVPDCYDFIEMDMYKIQIRLLNNKERHIFYTEEHFFHFYNLLTRKDKNAK